MSDWISTGFGVAQLFDPAETRTLILRLLLDLAVVWAIVGGVYVRLYRWSEHVFTYVVLNIVTFGLCFMLRQVPMDLGFALGLFAVFGILRYRTEAIRLRDLTYLFVMIGVAILNSIVSGAVTFVELLTFNGLIVLTTVAIERRGLMRGVRHHSVVYDQLELIQPGREAELFEDLYKRTGLRAIRYHVEDVDLRRDTATLRLECPLSEER